MGSSVSCLRYNLCCLELVLWPLWILSHSHDDNWAKCLRCHVVPDKNLTGSHDRRRIANMLHVWRVAASTCWDSMLRGQNSPFVWLWSVRDTQQGEKSKRNSIYSQFDLAWVRLIRASVIICVVLSSCCGHYGCWVIRMMIIGLHVWGAMLFQIRT